MSDQERLNQSKKKCQKDQRINRAVSGFVIPMLSIPALYRMLEAAVAAGGSDEDLKAVVAGFPGVNASTVTLGQCSPEHAS